MQQSSLSAEEKFNHYDACTLNEKTIRTNEKRKKNTEEREKISEKRKAMTIFQLESTREAMY